MYMSSLKKMPRWLTLFPWFVMVCALLFSAGIVVFGLHNAKRESDFTSQLTLEKGAALISALGILIYRRICKRSEARQKEDQA